jgi:PAS domain S-box-containing protein
MEALISGLAATVWERELESGRLAFISEQVEVLLGYPATQWMEAEDELWPDILHPDDRERVLRTVAEGVAEGRDWNHTYRLYAADGRIVWVQDAVHVATDSEGRPHWLYGVLIDVSEREIAERADAVLARAGAVLATDDPIPTRLQALLDAVVPDFGGLGVIALLGRDGLLHPVVAACPRDPALVVAGSELPPLAIPPSLGAQLATGHAVVVPGSGVDALSEVTDDDQLTARLALGLNDRVLVGLTAHGRLLGALEFATPPGGPPAPLTPTDLAAVTELGRRLSLLVNSDQAALREHQLAAASAALAAAVTVDDAAVALAASIGGALQARTAAVYASRHDADQVQLIHHRGFPDVDATDPRPPLTAPDTALEAIRSGRSLWPHGEGARWSGAAGSDAEATLAVLPLRLLSSTSAVLVLTFPSPWRLDPVDQQLATTLLNQGAQAFDRATLADAQTRIATALQQQLLPRATPSHPYLALAVHYQPAGTYNKAGGDWYEVVDLDPEHVGIVVGDVVGNGATAAAIMGQLRAALAGFLLAGHGCAEALDLLSKLTNRIDGALASTALCMVLNTTTGLLRWSSAGHPPPLVVEPEAVPPTRYLEGGSGIVLGAPDLLDTHHHHREATTNLAPGASLLLYTDGLVERRTESIDAGLERLAHAVSEHCGEPPARLLGAALAVADTTSSHSDDIAVVVARRLPVPPEPLPARA